MGQESVVEGLTIQKSVKYINLSMHVLVTNNLFYFNKFLPISSVFTIIFSNADSTPLADFEVRDIEYVAPGCKPVNVYSKISPKDT